jgi:hypothetical protein
MLALNSRAGRLHARLNLESLEARTLLSATLPTPTPVPVVCQQALASSIQVNHQATAQAAMVNFSYRWGIGPSAVLTGTNSSTHIGRSTGSVDFALVRTSPDAAPLGGRPTAMPLGFVVTTSSASPARPDHFNTTFTLSLRIRDASGVWGQVNFKGTVTGTLTANVSNLTITFKSPSQQLTLGHHVYSITLPKTIHPNGPADAPSAVYAFVSVRSR